MATKRHLMMLAAAAVLGPVMTASVLGATPPSYPDRPIRLVVPTTSGSLPDQLARWLGQQLSIRLGQSVVIDNRPGAGGTIGLGAVVSAPADGYTLGLHSLPFVVASRLIAKMPYDTERDLAPLNLVAWSYNLVVVPAASPLLSIADLVHRAKDNPDEVTFSSAGVGTPAHIALAMLAHRTGIKLTHVPYKGGPASVAAAVAGDVQVTTGGVRALTPLISGGRLRVLATTAPRRLHAFPEVPTLVELGYAGVEVADWQAVVAPAATPPQILERLNAEITAVLAQPQTRDQLEAMGMEPAGLGPMQFAAYQRKEMERWGALVREAGITLP